MEYREDKLILVSTGQILEDKAIENLLYGQREAAKDGDFASFMKITKYIMKLAEQRREKFIYIGSEVDDSHAEQPPKKG